MTNKAQAFVCLSLSAAMHARVRGCVVRMVYVGRARILGC